MIGRSPLRTRRLVTLLAAGLLLVAALVAAGPTGARPSADPAEGAWMVAPNAPFAFTRFDAEYSPATGKVYFLGGRLADASTDGSVWSFDPATGTYADTGVDMPVPISNYEIARLEDGEGDEVLVIFGGRPAAGGVVNTVQGYKPETNTVVDYTPTDPYPVLTSPGGVAVVDNIAYVFGGFDAVQVIANTYFFDITAPAGTRFTAGPDLNLARSYVGAAVVDGVIFAIGGDTFDGASLIPQAIVERLDTANPVAWDDPSAADLPLACDEMRSFGFDTGSAYELAGQVVVAGCGQWPNELPESLSYDVAADAWDQAFPDLNLARRNHAGAFAPTAGAGDPWAMWVWGGRQLDDTNVLVTPEYYEVLEVLPPALSVEKTVSDDGSCGTGNTLEVPPETEVTYCYTMANTGPTDLLVHTVEDDQLGLITGGPITFTVAPGESYSVTAAITVTASVTNTVIWTGFAAGGSSASATASASVTVVAAPPSYHLYLPVVVNPAPSRMTVR